MENLYIIKDGTPSMYRINQYIRHVVVFLIYFYLKKDPIYAQAFDFIQDLKPYLVSCNLIKSKSNPRLNFIKFNFHYIYIVISLKL